jgi:hypothetical protein
LPPTAGVPGGATPASGELLNPWGSAGGPGPKPAGAQPPAGAQKPTEGGGKTPATKSGHDATIDPWKSGKKDPAAGKNGTSHKKEGASKGKGSKNDGKQKGAKNDGKAKGKTKGSEHKNGEATW